MNLQTWAAVATILGTGLVLGGLIVGGVWRYWTWRQEHGTHVSVEISTGFLVLGTTPLDVVQVTVRNRSTHPVRVDGVAVEMNDGSKRAGIVTGLKVGANIPGVVGPHDSGSTWLETADLVRNGFDMFYPARARVSLSARDGFVWSKRRRLMKRG